MRPPLTAPTASLLFVAVGALLPLAAPQAGLALMVYTATGSGINGSLGGTPFSDASWTLTATADEQLSSNTIIPAGPAGSFNLWSLPVSPRLKIETTAALFEADLLAAGSFRWLALSGTFPFGPTPKIGFVYTTPSFQPETAAGVFGVPGSFVNLRSPTSVAGPSIFETLTYPTSAGSLVISSSSEVPGTFQITPVPTPLPALALAAAFSSSRRLRARRRRSLHPVQLHPSTDTL
jgi:hypothetical protein